MIIHFVTSIIFRAYLFYSSRFFFYELVPTDSILFYSILLPGMFCIFESVEAKNTAILKGRRQSVTVLVTYAGGS